MTFGFLDPQKRFPAWYNLSAVESERLFRRTSKVTSDVLKERFPGTRIGYGLSYQLHGALVGAACFLPMLPFQLFPLLPKTLTQMPWLSVSIVVYVGTIACVVMFIRQARKKMRYAQRLVARELGIDVCVRCDYSMSTGDPTAICPECGLDHQHSALGQPLPIDSEPV